MTEQNGSSDPHATGGVTPEQLKTLQDGILTTLRSDVNAAITTRLGGRDAMAELKATVQTLADQVQAQASAGGKPKPKAAGTGNHEGDQELQTQVQELQRQLQANQGELLRERRNAALRDAVVKSGVRPESVDDALRLLALRDDVKPSKDQDGNTIWKGQVRGELGDRVEANLDKVVEEFVGERRYMMPASGAGGSGATGGVSVPGGKPLEQMSEQELADLPPDQLNALWTAGGGNRSGGGFFT